MAGQPSIEGDGSIFDDDTASTMGAAVDRICQRLNINGDARAREVITMRVVDLVRSGERDLEKLCERVVSEASAGRI